MDQQPDPSTAQVHAPVRPGWDCRCGRPYPCDEVKASLPDPIDAAMYMAGWLADASADLDLPPRQMHERFMAWTRRRANDRFSGPGGTGGSGGRRNGPGAGYRRNGPGGTGTINRS